jgi:Domain of unknown function (DUF4386)
MHAQDHLTGNKVNSASSYRTAGMLAIVHALLIFVPLGVLGVAIGWPANLDLPASHNLPLVLSQSTGVKTGYSAYLLYSLLFFPAMFVIGQAITGNKPMSGIVKIALGFALISTLARCLGIIRWLSVMPMLATKFEKGDEATKGQISLIYDAFNTYSGSVGEVLGVSLFASFAVGLLSVAMLKSQRFPKWLAVIGLVATCGYVFLSMEIFGFDLGVYISPVSVIYTVWVVCAAVLMMRRAGVFSGESK